MEGSGNDNPPSTPPPPPTPQTAPQQALHTVSTIKLPILKKGEYDIWAIKMEHCLAHTNYPIWEVIQKGLVRERERKARTILLMALPEDHLQISQNDNAKDIWEAYKSRYWWQMMKKDMQEEPKCNVTVDGEKMLTGQLRGAKDDERRFCFMPIVKFKSDY
ncbi:hypothetical protein Tco_1005718 [Tanacetum coccineum]|uniref:Uncharacterized protein n=1 Tax=Tanacetum coccineum TaxID=301880 RepID=A0ABQ5FFP7_9ASTR